MNHTFGFTGAAEMQILGGLFGIVLAALLVVNGTFMLISPPAWFKLPFERFRSASAINRTPAMTYTCPYCCHVFAAAELSQPGGIGGGSYCPKCQQRVRISFAYGRLMMIVSLLLAIGTLLLARVRSIPFFVIGTLILWIGYSSVLNAYSMRFKMPALKKWQERRRTFFEWLYERDEPPTIMGKGH